MPSMTPDEIRELFPGTRDLIYLNAASQALLPLPVAERVEGVARRLMRRGITSFPEEMAQLERTRGLAARLIGCEPESIAFTANTAEGISRIAQGLDWREGDEVLLADLEFPANVYPWAAQRDRGVRLRFVASEEGRAEARRYIDAIGPRTRVLSVSHVQFASGYRVALEPLAEACRERGVLFVVDAIQSLGVCPLDLRGVGALAVDGRKWLMGPPGCGLLYVAPEWIERIRPRTPGALSVTHPEALLQFTEWLDAYGGLDLHGRGRLRPGAGRYESGYPNVVGVAGLGAALELGERIGRPEVHRRVAQLAAHAVRQLEQAGYPVFGPRDAEERAGIVAFSIRGSAEEVFRRLNEDGISISSREGRLRLAPHVYNTEEEVDRVVARVRELERS